MYQIRQLVMSSGERLPILCDASGRPLASPLLFSLTELRARGRSSASIRHSMESIMVLHKSMDLHEIDLGTRLAKGTFLQIQEVDLIVRDASQKIRAIGKDPNAAVGRAQAAARLNYIRTYLQWLGYCQLLRVDNRGQRYLELRDRIDKACAAIKARAPGGGVQSGVDQRQGLNEEDFSRVAAISVGSPEPSLWHRAHAVVRNQLILRWFIDLGIRRGELLGVCISDINFQQNTVRIERSADNAQDPRVQQPLTKTQARELLLSDELAQATFDYVMTQRALQDAAQRHDYLFVAGGTGKPLSISGLNKIFADMRRRDARLPSELTPHVLRHCWNDRFSVQMDGMSVDPEIEKRIRSTLMGWSMTSDTAATYTRRHVRRQASEAMRKMQSRLKMRGEVQ